MSILGTIPGKQDTTSAFFKKYYDITDQIADIGMGSYRYATISNDLDYKWLAPKYWKLDKFGNVINNWCTLYIGNINQSAFNPSEGSRTIPFNLFSREGSKSTDLAAITLYGVSIDLTAAPTVIETRVKGLTGPIYQTFGSNNYDLTISFLESGPTFWQQNSKDISLLTYILNSGVSINILNPQLNLIYNINAVICTGYNIGQDQRFYSHNNISISFKSDTITQDILTKTV